MYSLKEGKVSPSLKKRRYSKRVNTSAYNLHNTMNSSKRTSVVFFKENNMTINILDSINK